MSLTLAEILADAPDIQTKVIVDEFRKSSFLFDNMPFDSMSYPDASGNGWVYSYSRVTTQASAATRLINVEFTPSEAKRTPYTVNLKILGGSFNIDRAVANTGYAAQHIAFQLEQKRKAVIALFNDLIINGDDGNDPVTNSQFDGLDVILTGSSTESATALATDIWDLSSSADIQTNYKDFLKAFEDWLTELDGVPSVLFMNKKVRSIMRMIAKLDSTYTSTLNSFGQQIDTYNGIPMIQLDEKPGATTAIIPVEDRTWGGVTVEDLSDIYAVRFGLDGFHGIVPSDKKSAISMYLPDLKLPGAVKLGELEFITAIALKATKAAGVFRNIKVA
jgi:hypothetical protein